MQSASSLLRPLAAPSKRPLTMNKNSMSEPDGAWAPFKPDSQRPWTLPLAGHLYRRAGFGARWDELENAMTSGSQAAVDGLLNPAADVASFDSLFDSYSPADSESKDTGQVLAWWLRRMLETPHPLRERMTLFWHDYFGISNIEVENARDMQHYIQTLRRHALGKFPELLSAVASEPAMLICLHAKASRKSKPALQFPETLLKQYTIGAGHFTETDLREAARAFAGRYVLQHEVKIIAEEQDTGMKQFLGRQGPFGSAEVLDILARHPATAEKIVTRLYRWFISEADTPKPELLRPLVEDFARDFDIARLVGIILRSNCFFSQVAYRRRIKSPVEFALGILRPLNATVATLPLGNALAELGQELFQPPIATGWPCGRHWLNTFTMAKRIQLAQRLLNGGAPFNSALDWNKVMRQTRSADGASHLLDLWLQNDISTASRQAVSRLKTTGGKVSRPNLADTAAFIASLPEFQCS